MTDNFLRRTVYFTGHVQGVGFRYATERIAAGFDVTGFVRNLRDGRVELVVEGPVDQLDEFSRTVSHDLGGYITDERMSQAPATSEFDTFRIAF